MGKLFCLPIYISTHTSLAGRDSVSTVSAVHDVISTHTSLAGRDLIPIKSDLVKHKFLLTRPSQDVTEL